MSLVNDLLIEVDRRRQETATTPRTPAEGLEPNRRSPRTRRWGWIVGASIVVIGSGLWVAPSFPPTRHLTDSLTSNGQQASPLPAVSATRPRDDASAGSASETHAEGHGSKDGPPLAAPSETRLGQNPEHSLDTSPRFDSVIVRPPAIRDITFVQSPSGSRVRIETDGPVPYQIESLDDGRSLEVWMATEIVRDPAETLSLAGTPVRTLKTRGRRGETSIEFGFDRGIRVRSEFLEEPDGHVLVIDLDPIDRAMRSHPIRARAEGGERKALGQTLGQSTAGSDRVESVSLESSFDISRSADDQERTRLDVERRGAEAFVDRARHAARNDDLEAASSLYHEALARVPGHRIALQELAETQFALGRPEEAIDLVRTNRQRSPNDAGLAMLHAQLLARNGDLESAVEVLERSGHNLTQAPELHALSAAYLQKAGEHDLAIERYESLLRRYPERSNWWMGLGISLEAADRRLEAADVYRIAIQLGQLTPKTRRWLGARLELLDEEN